MAFDLSGYETVDSRIHRFYDAHPTGRIITAPEQYRDTPDGRLGQVIWRAEVFRTLDDLVPSATGYAEETLKSSGVNASSFVENAETSAIGRALANLGFSPKGHRPSLEEMQSAKAHQDMVADVQEVDRSRLTRQSDIDKGYSGPKGPTDATPKQLGMLRGLAKDKGVTLPQGFTDLTKTAASNLIKQWSALPDAVDQLGEWTGD